MVKQASIASLMDITSSLPPHYMVKLAEVATSEVISPKLGTIKGYISLVEAVMLLLEERVMGARKALSEVPL
ncbi:unnamed protein product [Ilex paraguariensis]|uniref:Uncharacterized protein n=1 Tax=Ilex paraguariensis TaxID=185542 RepID=A0ABC8RI35_9AQUA